jgi:predicted small metal-binding protein
MAATYSYACRNYPGMEQCPGRFYVDSEDEIWKLIEVHASTAHGEDPAAWTAQDRAYIKTFIRVEE